LLNIFVAVLAEALLSTDEDSKDEEAIKDDDGESRYEPKDIEELISEVRELAEIRQRERDRETERQRDRDINGCVCVCVSVFVSVCLCVCVYVCRCGSWRRSSSSS
jgi:hypothetical protein